MNEKGASIFESIIAVCVKVVAVALYIVTRFLETMLSGLNNYLKKKIDTKN
jgi:hypothetical protein